jgi:hypothetical protein
MWLLPFITQQQNGLKFTVNFRISRHQAVDNNMSAQYVLIKKTYCFEQTDSADCYGKISPKYKTNLFSPIKK